MSLVCEIHYAKQTSYLASDVNCIGISALGAPIPIMHFTFKSVQFYILLHTLKFLGADIVKCKFKTHHLSGKNPRNMCHKRLSHFYIILY